MEHFRKNIIDELAGNKPPRANDNSNFDYNNNKNNYNYR